MQHLNSYPILSWKGHNSSEGAYLILWYKSLASVAALVKITEKTFSQWTQKGPLTGVSCVILHTVCNFAQSLWFYIQCVSYTQCVMLHTFCDFSKTVLSPIYALLSVKISGLKICKCKKLTNIRYTCKGDPGLKIKLQKMGQCST